MRLSTASLTSSAASFVFSQASSALSFAPCPRVLGLAFALQLLVAGDLALLLEVAFDPIAVHGVPFPRLQPWFCPSHGGFRTVRPTASVRACVTSSRRSRAGEATDAAPRSRPWSSAGARRPRPGRVARPQRPRRDRRLGHRRLRRAGRDPRGAGRSRRRCRAAARSWHRRRRRPRGRARLRRHRRDPVAPLDLSSCRRSRRRSRATGRSR